MSYKKSVFRGVVTFTKLVIPKTPQISRGKGLKQQLLFSRNIVRSQFPLASCSDAEGGDKSTKVKVKVEGAGQRVQNPVSSGWQALGQVWINRLMHES